jgi:4-hydroxythreonine-4-phosphate dehydrogenase
MGEPSGVGPEVIVKALADEAVRGRGRFVIYGIERRLAEVAEQVGVRPFWFRMQPGEPMRIDSGVVVLDYEAFAATVWTPPRISAEGGLASIRFLDEAVEAALRGEIDAVVTAPIHKGSWKLAKCRFPGHTERISHACRSDRTTMMFSAGDLRVALASTHVGLFELRNKFTIGLVFQPIDLLHQALTNWFGIVAPRIAVAGLNPHAGEDGRFGDEERRVIEPAVQMARNAGVDVLGPLPADSLFAPRVRQEFDGIVAMYHDQGLIPVKMHAFDEAVNITLGLPIIRTGVGHGTAFDIAGTKQANPGSMKEAIRLACAFACRNEPSDSVSRRQAEVIAVPGVVAAPS